MLMMLFALATIYYRGEFILNSEVMINYHQFDEKLSPVIQKNFFF